MKTFSPPFNRLAHLAKDLSNNGFVLLNPHDFFTFTGTQQSQWDALKTQWTNLELDAYLKDGGKYRQRKHASVIVHEQKVQSIPYRPHYQPTSYNALHGGMQRWFTPCDETFVQSNSLQQFLIQTTLFLNGIENQISEPNQLVEVTNEAFHWYTEIHQFRIDTSHGIGRPTPEGAHRDGVNYVAVILVDRHDVQGGESRVFAINSPNGQRFTLEESWTLLLLDDQQVLHETTPIQPLDRKNPKNTWRDTLVVTFRKESFLEDQP